MTEQIQQENNKEIDLIEIIMILWQSRKFIAIVTGISLVIGIIYIIFATPMYSGTITLYPAQSSSKSQIAKMAIQMGMTGASSGDANYNIPDVVKSRMLSEQIVTHEWLVDGYEKKINLVEYFDKLWNINESDYVLTKEDKRSWKNRQIHNYSSIIAKERIKVKTNASTGLISVTVLMEDSRLASDIANFISVFVANWVNNTQKESIRKNLEFINERTAILSVELQAAENELKKFRETNRNILNSPDLQLELQRFQRQVIIKQEVYLTMVKQREINQIEKNQSSDVIRILDKAIEPLKASKPRKIFIIFQGFAIGFLFSIIYLVSNYIIKKILVNRNN